LLRYEEIPNNVIKYLSSAVPKTQRKPQIISRVARIKKDESRYSEKRMGRRGNTMERRGEYKGTKGIKQEEVNLKEREEGRGIGVTI
jgi:hypothetical protein